MTRTRIIVFLITVAVVIGSGYLVSLYARGYRFNEGKISPNGLLVIKSAPDGAQVFINGEFKTATNATIPLSPATYDIKVEKQGYLPWSKRLVIEKEVVTEATAHLFKSAPSLSAITLASAIKPVASYDSTKIAYIVSPNTSNNSKDTQGLWIMEMLNLPLGFSREPKRITDRDLTKATFKWSPNGREILLTTESGAYLLDSGVFTSQSQLVNIVNKKEIIEEEWLLEKEKILTAQVEKLPDELKDIIKRKTKAVSFSPDEDMIVYTASQSGKLPENLIKQLPGASTQKQERDIKKDHTYVYDIKEDRNFLIDSNASDLVIEGGYATEAKRRLSWFPTSRHLILAEEDKITILDYDGTNRQIVYAGNYITPHTFPTLSIDRLIILTNLGATSTPSNLYSLSIK
jgi:hypothetical protein